LDEPTIDLEVSGYFEVEYFPQEGLMKARDAWDGMRQGVLDIAMSPSGYQVDRMGVAGATEWLSYSILMKIGTLPLYGLIVGTVLSVSLFHNLLSSNTVTAIVLTPIIIYIALGMNLPVWLAVAPAAFASTLGLIMVTSTPTNLIPYSAGYFSIKDFAAAGIFITPIGSVAIGSVIYLMHILFGIV